MPLSKIKSKMEVSQLRLDSSAASTDENERVLLDASAAATDAGYAIILEDSTDNEQFDASSIDATVTVGVDDTGYDVKFFGDTASASMLWDTSADDLILGGAANLGIGIAPTNRFHIKQLNNGETGSFRTERSDTTAYSVIYMGGDDVLYIQNQASGAINFYTGGALALSIAAAGSSTHGGHVLASADSSYDIGATATRWRQGFFDEVEIGTNTGLAASASNALFVNYAGAGAEYAVEIKTAATTGTALYFLHSTTTVCGSISVGSSATAYNTSSDYRLKENVVDMTGAITRLKTLKPKRFSWIIDENNELLDGFLAHEVDEIVPQAIHGEKDEMKDGEILPQGIDQSKLIPLLTGAIKELIAKVETLESKVTALEAA